MTLATTPAPTVLPPSRIPNRKPCSIAIGAISSTTILMLSPGITISVPSASSFNAAYPLASSALHIDITTTGPAALGGIALTALGLLLLLCALLVAIGGQVGQM